MRIYLIRHADPDYRIDGLTPAGHREAQALAEHLTNAGLDEIYASPLGRAQQTAGYTADRLNLPVTVEPWARELKDLLSEAHQRQLWDIDGAVLRGPEVLADLNHWQQLALFSGQALGEIRESIRVHSDSFLLRQGFARDGHLYRFERENRKRIAFFAHLGFGLAWLSHLLEIPLPLMWAGFYLHPSSVTTILFDERSPGTAVPRVIGMGDLSHLARAGLDPTPSGVIANYY
jgi:broad specificity phosphatase PhoE